MNQLAESLIKTDKSQTVKIPSFVCQQTSSWLIIDRFLGNMKQSLFG